MRANSRGWRVSSASNAMRRSRRNAPPCTAPRASLGSAAELDPDRPALDHRRAHRLRCYHYAKPAPATMENHEGRARTASVHRRVCGFLRRAIRPLSTGRRHRARPAGASWQRLGRPSSRCSAIPGVGLEIEALEGSDERCRFPGLASGRSGNQADCHDCASGLHRVSRAYHGRGELGGRCRSEIARSPISAERQTAFAPALPVPSGCLIRVCFRARCLRSAIEEINVHADGRLFAACGPCRRAGDHGKGTGSALPGGKRAGARTDSRSRGDAGGNSRLESVAQPGGRLQPGRTPVSASFTLLTNRRSR